MAPEYLVLLHGTRNCKKCGERTYWSLESQLWTDKGICLFHAGEIYERGERPTELAAKQAVIRALGPVYSSTEDTGSATSESTSLTLRWVCSGLVQRLTSVLVPSYVGRCAGCGTAVRRYGPRGRPLCDHCAAV